MPVYTEINTGKGIHEGTAGQNKHAFARVYKRSTVSHACQEQIIKQHKPESPVQAIGAELKLTWSRRPSETKETALTCTIWG